MRTQSSRIVYRNAWMSVREDGIVHADGSPGVYGVVDKPDFALILPRHEDGFWLVEQYRYPVQRRAWEFPQGSWPAGTSGSSEDLARAELAEEVGVIASSVEWLGHLYPAYGFSSQGFDVFLATGLVEGEPRRESTEQDMVHRWFADQELDAMIRGGQLIDAASIASLALFRMSTDPLSSGA